MSELDTPTTWDQYFRNGRERCLNLGNRGPMRFADNGRLAQDILDAYREHGFYVFTGVLSQDETDELTRELDEIMDNAPVSRDKPVDKHGRPSKFAEYYTLTEDDPAIVRLLSHVIMMKDAALRAYAHPQILRMVASINGPDFVPFHEAVQYKVSGNGPPTNWHQDGRTHWTDDGRLWSNPTAPEKPTASTCHSRARPVPPQTACGSCLAVSDGGASPAMVSSRQSRNRLRRQFRR